jgi:hypothetical protein
MPGWLSNTLISGFMGFVLLFIFKYTSNQRAIGRVRDNITANILAMKLFKDSLRVTLNAQAHLFGASLKLLRYSIIPLFAMVLPVSLLMGQMGLWYQSCPLRPGEEANVIMKLRGHGTTSANVNADLRGAEVVTGPVRVMSKNEIYWRIRAVAPGYHKAVFKVDERKLEKELAVGEGYMRVSRKKPDYRFLEILIHPAEKPFPRDARVESIEITYPDRISWISGTDYWLIYFFACSMVFALVIRPFIGVRI